MREGTPYGKMSNSDRRRSSKWDSKEESHIALENIHDSGKSGLSFHDRDLRDLPGRTASRRDDNSIDEDCDRNSWEEEHNYGTQMSPGLDDWRQRKTHQESPINKLKRSRSPSQNRSRSRSPVRGFGRELGPNDRSRSTATVRRGNYTQFFHNQKAISPKYPTPSDSREYPKSSNPCTDFLKGSCRRGSSCRFAHHGASDESTRRPRDDREPRRPTDIPCKFFAAGNCRNGKFCRFSHLDQSYPTPDKSRVSLDPLIDVKIVESKKNEVLPWGNAADDEIKLAGENWLGDMDMSPEWNYKVQTPKPIDKPSELNLAEIGFGASMPLTPSSHGTILPSFNPNGSNPNVVPPQIQDDLAIIKPNSISNEQLTTISASIAQLLANGLPFQQIQGALAQNTIQSSPFNNEGPMGMQKQYDPTTDSIEVEKREVSDNPPGFFPTPSSPKKTTDVKLEVTSNNISGKEEADEKSCQVIIQLEPGPTGAGAKDNGPSENDGKVEEGKKGKETKGVKAFKFALVEFVKEILKPTWKEGQMSKDAYKNIVKKVVEKVTGTVQGDNVPQTQEKIQQYLSHSKPKLTKLVQAYVEKYQKDK